MGYVLLDFAAYLSMETFIMTKLSSLIRRYLHGSGMCNVTSLFHTTMLIRYVLRIKISSRIARVLSKHLLRVTLPSSFPYTASTVGLDFTSKLTLSPKIEPKGAFMETYAGQKYG